MRPRISHHHLQWAVGYGCGRHRLSRPRTSAGRHLELGNHGYQAASTL